MKIIFLDIDGVMNSEVYHKNLNTKKKGWRRFDPEAVKMVTKLVEEFDAKIVISSLWRFAVKKELATFSTKLTPIHPETKGGGCWREGRIQSHANLIIFFLGLMQIILQVNNC